VAVIEAMKMENVLFAAADGVVASAGGQGRQPGGGPADHRICMNAKVEFQMSQVRPFKVLASSRSPSAA